MPLNQLTDWEIDELGITCKKQADFMVRFYDIKISGREVQCWTQPLFKSLGMATFGLMTRVKEGRREFLVRIRPEIGSFDKVEIGPSVQWEPSHNPYNDDVVEICFRKHIEKRDSSWRGGVILSEEGGRFYHEENYNFIIEIDEKELPEIPDDCIWVDYRTLNFMVQINNCLNIQLRNLLSLITI